VGSTQAPVSQYLPFLPKSICVLSPGPTPWAYTLGLHPGPTPWAYTLGLHPGPTPWAYTQLLI